MCTRGGHYVWTEAKCERKRRVRTLRFWGKNKDLVFNPILKKISLFSTTPSNNKIDYYYGLLDLKRMKWSTEKLHNLCLHTQPGFSVVFAFTSPPPGRNSHPCPTFPSLAQNWQTDSYSDCLLENAYPQQASLDHCGHDGLLAGKMKPCVLDLIWE